MSEEPQRMWIDVRPPDRPEPGDVWIARGELRTWKDGRWDPPWLPPLPQVPACYPRAGRRKKERVS